MKIACLLVALIAPWTFAQTAAAPAAAMVTVHIYRTGSRGNGIQILIDRQQAFKLGYRESATFQLAAGNHEIAAHYGDRKPNTSIELRAGREYFFELPFKAHRAGALAGLVDPADALDLDIVRQPGPLPDGLHEHSFDADKLAWIASLRSPIQDP